MMNAYLLLKRVLSDTDTYIFGGLAGIGGGLWLVSPALGIAVPGGLLFALGLYMSHPGRS